MQHSKAVPGDHDLNRLVDTIVIDLLNASEAAFAGALELQRNRAGQNAQLHCR
jgi:hypothetical protein